MSVTYNDERFHFSESIANAVDRYMDVSTVKIEPECESDLR